MSVVAVKIYDDKIEIASDSISVRGYTQDKIKYGKLFKVEDIIVGSVGYAAEASMLKIFLKNHKPKSAIEDDIMEFFVEFMQWYKLKDNKAEYYNDYLIVFNKKCFKFSNLLVTEIKNYCAIGAGSDYALTALYLGHDVRKSIECACHLNIYCEKPINKFYVKK